MSKPTKPKTPAKVVQAHSKDLSLEPPGGAAEGEEDDILNKEAVIEKVRESVKEFGLEFETLEEFVTLMKGLTPIQTKFPKSGHVTPNVPSTFSVMSWNTDGIHLRHLGKRSAVLVDLIEAEAHDIVFLQELRTLTFNYIVSRLQDKYVIIRQENKNYYFTATLLKRQTVKYESHKVIHFKNTNQGRAILHTKASIGSARLELMNIHLESTGGKNVSQVRMAQLQKCLKIMSSNPPDLNVLIAGDTNIRDWEMAKMVLPKKAVDIWVDQGSKTGTQWTWDLSVNKTLVLDDGQVQPRKRYDRFFFRPSNPEAIQINDFNLSGQIKLVDVEEEDFYPSDHWAIVSKFLLLPNARRRLPSGSRSDNFPTRSASAEKANNANQVVEEEDEATGSDDNNGNKGKDEFVKENWDDEDED